MCSRVALGRLHDDPELRERLGTAARELCVATFEIGPVAEGWLAVLASVAAS